jgi:hypothetical protein
MKKKEEQKKYDIKQLIFIVKSCGFVIQANIVGVETAYLARKTQLMYVVITNKKIWGSRLY